MIGTHKTQLMDIFQEYLSEPQMNAATSNITSYLITRDHLKETT